MFHLPIMGPFISLQSRLLYFLFLIVSIKKINRKPMESAVHFACTTHSYQNNIKQNNRIPVDVMDASKTISRHRGFPSVTSQ